MSLYTQIFNDPGRNGYSLALTTEELGTSTYYVFSSGMNETDDDAVLLAVKNALSTIDTGYTVTATYLAKENFEPSVVS